MRRPLHNFSSTSSPSSGSTRHSSISGDIKSTQGGITTYDNDEDEKDLGNNGQIGLLLDRRGKQEKALADSSIGNPQKGSVCELMTRRGFHKLISIINPTLRDIEIHAIYDHAIELSHKGILKTCSKKWKKMYTNNEKHTKNKTEVSISKFKTETFSSDFYVDKNHKSTQWKCPYINKTFRTEDINLSTFLDILLFYDVIASSPYQELLNISPKDLWPNIDIFAARVKDIDSYGIIKKKSIQGENFVSLAELYGYGGLRGKTSLEAVSPSAKGASSSLESPTATNDLSPARTAPPSAKEAPTTAKSAQRSARNSTSEKRTARNSIPSLQPPDTLII
mmetsp:Transcript_29603/g.28331  ORF Transcript_29603/g.28331 Transcript_29603/m.28331 type:complete len:336 (+) Transcript_29603:641-1648(+)